MTLKSRLVQIKDLCNNAVYFLATHFISAFDVRTKLSKIRTERDRNIFKMKFHFLVQKNVTLKHVFQTKWTLLRDDKIQMPHWEKS